jgi:hypothetical protein
MTYFIIYDFRFNGGTIMKPCTKFVSPTPKFYLLSSFPFNTRITATEVFILMLQNTTEVDAVVGSRLLRLVSFFIFSCSLCKSL